MKIKLSPQEFVLVGTLFFSYHSIFSKKALSSWTLEMFVLDNTFAFLKSKAPFWVSKSPKKTYTLSLSLLNASVILKYLLLADVAELQGITNQLHQKFTDLDFTKN